MSRTAPHLRRVRALLALVVLVLACTSNDSPTGPDRRTVVATPVRASVVEGPSNQAALPVDRVHIEVVSLPDSALVGALSADVDASAAEWDITVESEWPVGTNEVTVEVRVLLVAGGTGPDSVQYSGIAGPVTFGTALPPPILELELGRGPLANAFVTGVTIDSAPDSLIEGATSIVSASATTSGTGTPVIFWSVLDSAVLSLTDSVLSAVLPGTGRLVATAGRFADTATVAVVGIPVALAVSPDTAVLDTLGVDATFTATVLDARGDPVSGQPVEWFSLAPQLAESRGSGVFRSLGFGDAGVRARLVADSTIYDEAVLRISGSGPIPAVDVRVAKTVDDPNPLPDSTVTFTVTVTNDGPGGVSNVAVLDVLDSVFVSPAHAVSAGALAGDTLWTIPSLAEGASETWTTTAVVSAGAAGGSATNTAAVLSLAENDTVSANDSMTVAMSFPISALPVVTITSPPDSAVFDPGALVTFSATANDLEDGSLSGSIAWSSSRDGALGSGASIQTDQLSTGVHTISASATDSDGGVGADTITVTVALYTVPATLNVPFGGTASLPISLTGPAPTGGVTLTVTTQDPAITRPQSTTVFIPEGVQSANATLDGISPGTTTVSVSSAQFGVVTTTVSVTAQLNILAGSVRFPNTFTQEITIRLETQGGPLAAPSGGLPVSFTSRDPGCVAAPGQATIPGGLISTTSTLLYGGVATPVCTTYLVATAPNAQPDSVQVTIDPTPNITMQNRTIGSGLQEYTSVSLGATLPAGDTLTITSADANVLLAANATTPGSTTLHLVGPFNSANFYLQAVEGFTGGVVLTGSAPGYNSGESTATVVPPGVRIRSVQASTTTLSNNDVIYADVGPENGAGALSDLQQIRAGGSPVTVTFISTVDAVGTLVTQTATNDTVTAQIQPSQSNTPTSLATGGVEFDPLTAGTTDVYVEAAGFISVDTTTVTISAPNINMQDRTVGSGLQEYTSVSLGAPLPDGDTLTIRSSNPSVLLAPDANTPGSTVLELAGPFSTGYFYIQAVEPFTGQATLTATAPGFNLDESTATVVAPGVRIRSVQSTTTTLSNNDIIYADVGPENGSGALSDLQQVRAGGSALTVTFISSTGTVATLTTQTATSDTVTAEIQPTQSNTPTTLAAGGVELDPLAAGTSEIFVEAPGYISVDTTTITVTAPNITMFDRTVGSGLQEFTSVSMGATLPDGDTLTIVSSDPAVLLSLDGASAGSTTLQVAGPFSSRSFYIQAVEPFTGAATLTATAPGFNGDSSIATVVSSGVRIRSVLTSTTTLSGNDVIYADIGPENGSGALSQLQPVRGGAPPVTVTFISTAGSVATLVTQTATNDTVTAQIQAGLSNTPTQLVSGGVELDPQTAGSSDIYVESPGFISVDTSTITVTAPAITMFDRTVGSGLQEYTTVSMGATLPAGDTLMIVSSDPNVLLAAEADVVGSDTLRLVGPFNSRYFYIQAVEGFTGQATLTASAPGFTDDVSTATVVTPGIRIRSVNASYSAGALNDAIWADIGPENGAGALSDVQQIRAGANPLVVTFESSLPSAATLVSQTQTAGTVTTEIQPGVGNTPTSLATGGVELDPLAAGPTTISVTATGFIPAGNAIAVTINP